MWAINNTEQIDDLNRRARDSVQAEFSWDAIASRYVELYREVVNSP